MTAWAVAAQDVLPVPALSAHVIDTTGTLEAPRKAALEEKLRSLEEREGTQLVVLMVPSTKPEDIASFANRVANEWKIGRRGIGDGILLLVAKNDRALRIEVAKTLEGAVPDLAAKRIIDEAITPRFKQGEFAQGLEAGVDALIARIATEGLPAPVQKADAKGLLGQNFDWMDLLVFTVFALPIGAPIARGIFGRKFGSLITGAAVGGLALVFTASVLVAGIAALVALVYALMAGSASSGLGGALSRAGGFGSSIGSGSRGGWSGGGGGGFSSGGGGDFGGGGASGKW